MSLVRFACSPAVALLLAGCSSTSDDDGAAPARPAAAPAVPARGARRHRQLRAAGPADPRHARRTSRSRSATACSSATTARCSSPIATQTLDRQAAWLQQYPDVVLTVEGHTDERGTREYNLALGDRRANAVKNYLVALGIDPGRILTISYGEERPAEPANDETAWAKNRRAVSVVSTTN